MRGSTRSTTVNSAHMHDMHFRSISFSQKCQDLVLLRQSDQKPTVTLLVCASFMASVVRLDSSCFLDSESTGLSAAHPPSALQVH
jgi:hypothetical protein